MNASITSNERNHPDQHRRTAGRAAETAMAKGDKHAERQARAWGKLAAANINAGNYKTAMTQLAQGMTETAHSQYAGPRFDG